MYQAATFCSSILTSSQSFPLNEIDDDCVVLDYMDSTRNIEDMEALASTNVLLFFRLFPGGNASYRAFRAKAKGCEIEFCSIIIGRQLCLHIFDLLSAP